MTHNTNILDRVPLNNRFFFNWASNVNREHDVYEKITLFPPGLVPQTSVSQGRALTD